MRLNARFLQALGLQPEEFDALWLNRTLEDFLTSVGPGPDLGAGESWEREESVSALLLHIRKAVAPPLVSGYDLLEHERQHVRMVPTGCDNIDALLGGGLRVTQLAEVCGEPGAGKTQLCMSLAAQCAARAMRVVYIDTGNAFTAARFRALLRGVAYPALGLEEAQQCLTLHRLYDVHALLGVVDALIAQQSAPAVPPARQEEGLEEEEEEGPLIDLVIVDSLGALIAPVLGGGQHSQGHALLAAAAGGLKRLAAAASVPVVVTNHMVGGDDAARGEKRPALGESWRNQPHLRLHLSGAAAPEGDPYTRSRAEPCWASLRYSTARGPAGPAPFWVTPTRLLSQPPPQQTQQQGPQQDPQAQQQQQAQRMDVG